MHSYWRETAEMPGVYRNKDYDCAGFVSAWSTKTRLLMVPPFSPGDVAVGISSSGFIQTAIPF